MLNMQKQYNLFRVLPYKNMSSLQNSMKLVFDGFIKIYKFFLALVHSRCKGEHLEALKSKL